MGADDLFEIQVVDDETGRGVPLVELETTNAIRHVTDSAGRIAFNEPGLNGQEVYFSVRSHGYEHQPDGFGFRGVRLQVEAGGKAIVKVQRINIAERLYRVTGGGIYRDSALLGHGPPIKHPLLNARVFGSDSVINVVHNGKLHWFWGDTNRPSYPLGNFHVPGATSELPGKGGLDPNVGINLDYYADDDGFARPTAQMPGEGPTWIDAAATLKDASGQEHLYAAYVKIKPPLTTSARGLIRFNDETDRFEKIADLPLDSPIRPSGHPFKHTIDQTEYLYFATPYPLTRVKATAESYQRLDEYEAWTCLTEGSTLDDIQLDRDESGMLRYSWKRNTPALDSEHQKALVADGKLKETECITLRDRQSGKSILAHGGSVYWNEFRRRWIMIFVEGYGEPSFVGEVWYAEADSPVGPWAYAEKIATHDRYDFYNPKQHPAFDQDGGKTIFFEGTYTNTFSGNPIKTPRYDYNQIMYKLRLDDPRLILPVPIYRTVNHEEASFRHGAEAGSASPDDIAFFALDRPMPTSVPFYQITRADGGVALAATPSDDSNQTIAFHALPADTADPPATTEKLYRCTNDETDDVKYLVESEKLPIGFQRDVKPLCLVWKNPIGYTWDPVE